MRFAVPVALVLVLAQSPASAQEPVLQTPAGVLLDFQNADLRVVLAAIAEAGGFNVVYGDLPPRNVTLRLSRPVPGTDLLAILHSVARANGLRVEEEAGMLRIDAETQPVHPAAEAEPATPGPERRLHVYRLRHAQAPRLAQTLGALFGTGAAWPGVQPTRPAGRDDRTQRIPPIDLDSDAAVPTEMGGARRFAVPADLRGDVQIVPDEVTNSLLIRASEVDFAVISQAIEALDLRPLQALIEGLMVEVRRDREHEVGISVGRIDSLSSPIGRRVDGVLRGAGGGDLTLTIRDLGGLGIDAAISLLAATGEVRVISRPVILAQNNQEARILVGAERPFVQVFRSLPTEAAIRDQIVQYRDVGTSLTITPTINPDGYINLDVLQEVSMATAETQFGAPIISTRQASTRLFVRDGQSVVIGGLIDEQIDRIRTGVPLLKDIPILGYLFGTTRERRIQSELFLFLTPYVIESDLDMDLLREAVEGRPKVRPLVPEPLLPTPTIPADTVPPGVH